jgi:hypothetical protein
MYGARTLFAFCGGAPGRWIIDRMTALRGEPLPAAERLHVAEGMGDAEATAAAAWVLRGVTGALRYTTRGEAVALAERRAALDRPAAIRAALIPIRKREDWWALAHDERRAIYEERSRHTSIGMEYLPRIARRLHHSRDLGEPFDFLTWFEFAPEHEPAFDELLARLREREEWTYVDREIDIRLSAG